MKRDEAVLKLKPELQKHLEKNGFILADIRFLTRKGTGVVLEILADRSEGGITLGECAQLSRQLGDIIEALGYIQHPYVLEVSSPGLDRPLATLADFRRAQGNQVRCFLKEAVEDKIEHVGEIRSVEEDKIVLQTETKLIEIPLAIINKAKQVIL